MKNRIPSLDQYSKLNESKEHYLLQQILILTKDADKSTALHTIEKIQEMIETMFPSL